MSAEPPDVAALMAASKRRLRGMRERRDPRSGIGRRGQIPSGKSSLQHVVFGQGGDELATTFPYRAGTVTSGSPDRSLLSKRDIPPRERLIVALDVESRAEAEQLVDQLGDAVDFYKVGWELLLSGDYMDLVVHLSLYRGKKVFADLKVHEIPMTVRRAMRQLRDYHVEFVTLHAQESAAIAAAVEEKNGIKVLGVTVLTSLDESDLRADGISDPVETVVQNRARRALEIGADGVIASGREAPALRKEFGDGIVVVVPGIRGEKSAPDDQKRTVDVEEAFLSGADYIVVGREIRDAPDPLAAANAIQERIERIFSET